MILQIIKLVNVDDDDDVLKNVDNVKAKHQIWQLLLIQYRLLVTLFYPVADIDE